jgi:hypothetical protein
VVEVLVTAELVEIMVAEVVLEVLQLLILVGMALVVL